MADRVDLALAQRLADEATPGPWHSFSTGPARGVKTKLGCYVALTHHDGNMRIDAEFIAAARSLVPALVAELVGLREATNRIRQLAVNAKPEAGWGCLCRWDEDGDPIGEHGPNCFKTFGWSLDPAAVLAILDGDPK